MDILNARSTAMFFSKSVREIKNGLKSGSMFPSLAFNAAFLEFRKFLIETLEPVIKGY